MSEPCDVKYGRHESMPHLIAICVRPKGHDGDHSNVLHKPGWADEPVSHEAATSGEEA